MEQRRLLDHILELAHIARPAVCHEHGTRRVVERHARHGIALGKIRGKLAGQQYDVSPPVAQRRHRDGHRRQTIIEVLPEPPLGHGLGHVDIGGSHDAHVRLLHGRRAHLDELASLEHAQQSGLSGQGQLGHLVEKDGAAVGLLEIALAGRDSAGEGPFLVAEQLGVYRALGDGATVDSDVAGMLARRESVDNLRKKLLARAALARDEHRQVYRSHPHRAHHGLVEFGRIAYDAIAATGLKHLGRIIGLKSLHDYFSLESSYVRSLSHRPSSSSVAE